MKKILRYLRSSLGYLYVCFKWVILAALVGCVVGPFGAMFGLALNKATALRTADPRLIYLLPLGGLVIVFLYQHFDPDGGGSTNQIFVAVREHKPLSLRTAPLIFVTPLSPICSAVPAAVRALLCCWGGHCPGRSAGDCSWRPGTAA